MKSVTPNSEFLTSLSDENNFEKKKIKSLEEEIKKLKNENTTLRENILTQFKLLKIYLVITTEIQRTLPS